MRLSWKLFFLTTPVFVLFLTIFGAWIIQSSFDSSLEKELDRCMVENELFQTSYELSLNSLSEEQREQTTVRRIIESFHKNRGKARETRGFTAKMGRFCTRTAPCVPRLPSASL